MAHPKTNTPKTAEEKSLYNKEYLKKWRAKNPDYMKKWVKDNPKRDTYMKKYHREWYLKNRERLLPEFKKYREQLDRNTVNAYLRAWGKADRIKNPLKARMKLHARRTKTNGIKIVKEEIYNWDSRICGICKKYIPLENEFHIDHIIPISKNGLHEVGNLQLAHPICNLVKGNRV